MDKAKNAWIKDHAPWILVVILLLGAAYLAFDVGDFKAMRDDERQARISIKQEARELRNRISSLQSNLDAVNLQLKAKSQATSTRPVADRGRDAQYIMKLLKDGGLDRGQLIQGLDPEYPEFGNRWSLIGRYTSDMAFKLIYKISNHAEDGWLLVYDAPEAMRLVYLDENTKQGYVVTNSTDVSYTGNSGGTWYPVAFTKDDKKLVMCAMMGDPGAGGSNVDYGCDLLPLKPLDGRSFYLWQTAEELPGMTVNPRFSYDQMGKTIYTAMGDKTPHHSQPGPSTPSVIMYRNLVTGNAKALLEEPDTTYELKSLDEKAGTLTFEATKYRYPEGCNRGDGGLMDEALDCAEIASTSTRTLRLP